MISGASQVDSTYDLTGLAPYDREDSTEALTGVVRIHGSPLTLSLIHRWEEEFLRFHPHIRYRDNILPSTASTSLRPKKMCTMAATRSRGRSTSRARENTCR
jgi:hypothetical protein